jgi:hypothetical protein
MNEAMDDNNGARMIDEGGPLPETSGPVALPVGEPEPVDFNPEEAPQQANGVLIVRIDQEDGGIKTDVIPVGDARATEVSTLIELGLAAWRAKIGLDG